MKQGRHGDTAFDIRTTLTFSEGSRGFGPNKMSILEAIDTHASLSAAAKATRISYHHVWMMVGQMNRDFCEPVVVTKMGRRGGASLTPMGKRVLTQFRAMEQKIAAAAARHLAMFGTMISQTGSSPQKTKSGRDRKATPAKQRRRKI